MEILGRIVGLLGPRGKLLNLIQEFLRIIMVLAVFRVLGVVWPRRLLCYKFYDVEVVVGKPFFCKKKKFSYIFPGISC